MPPGVVTETFLDPVFAVALIVMFALIFVELSTVKLLTLIPAPKLTAVAPVKFTPLIVTFRFWPRVPRLGLTLATVGGASSTMKPLIRVPVPPAVLTETFLDPGTAAPLQLMLEVICVAFFTVKLLTVIPTPKLTAVAPLKLVPVIVTLRLCP